MSTTCTLASYSIIFSDIVALDRGIRRHYLVILLTCVTPQHKRFQRQLVKCQQESAPTFVRWFRVR